MKEYILQISDFEVKVSFSYLAHEAFDIPSQYQPFLMKAEQSSGQFLFKMEVDDGFTFSEQGEKIGHFNSGGNSQDVFKLKDGSYHFLLGEDENRLSCMMQSSADFSYNIIALKGGPNQYLFGFNNAMMIAFAFASSRHGTLLMHSSVTLLDGYGYMFLGVSGTGKSTHSQLWLKNFEGTELLNDDNPAVRIQDDTVTVYGTPWSGKTPCYKKKQAAVGAFVMLQQKPYNKIQRMNVIKSLAALLSSCSSMIWDKTVHQALCDNLDRIIRLIPVYQLECLPDDEAAKVCREAIVK